MNIFYFKCNCVAYDCQKCQLDKKNTPIDWLSERLVRNTHSRCHHKHLFTFFIHWNYLIYFNCQTIFHLNCCHFAIQMFIRKLFFGNSNSRTKEIEETSSKWQNKLHLVIIMFSFCFFWIFFCFNCLFNCLSFIILGSN